MCFKLSFSPNSFGSVKWECYPKPQELISKYGWLLEICKGGKTSKKKKSSRVDEHVCRVTEAPVDPSLYILTPNVVMTIRLVLFYPIQLYWWKLSFFCFFCFLKLRAGRTSEKYTEETKYSVWWSALFLEVLPSAVMSQNPIWVWFPLTLCYLTENNCFPETWGLHSKCLQMTKKVLQ